jgi:Holliday junction resolvase
LPTSRYRQGYYAENEAVKIFKEAGFQARREFRSGNNWFGKFYPRGDVIATHPKAGFIFVEVKRTTKREKGIVRIPANEGKKLQEWAQFFLNASESKIPFKLLFAVRFPQKKWWIKEIPWDSQIDEITTARAEDAEKNGLAEYLKTLVTQE